MAKEIENKTLRDIIADRDKALATLRTELEEANALVERHHEFGETDGHAERQLVELRAELKTITEDRDHWLAEAGRERDHGNSYQSKWEDVTRQLEELKVRCGRPGCGNDILGSQQESAPYCSRVCEEEHGASYPGELADGEEIDASFEVVSDDPAPVDLAFSDLLDSEPKTPYDISREAFNEYAGMDAPNLPEHPASALQVLLHRWEARQFGGGSVGESTLGVNEETGELSEAFIYLAAMQCGAGRMAHAVLKRGQGIRGFDDPEVYRSHAADAIADVAIFAMQCATKLRLDFWQIVEDTANQVMGRDWSKKTQPTPAAQGFTQVRGEDVELDPGTDASDARQV